MPPGVSLLLLSLAQGALRFLGSPHCPEPATVEDQLRLVDPHVLETSPHLVMLEEHPRGLEIRLFDEGGQLLEERLVPGPKSCAEWARIAAALLATWETDLAAPELSLPAASGVPLAAPATAQPQAPDRKPRWRGELGLGLSGSIANDGSFAFGGAVLTDLAPPTGPFGGQVILAGTGYRSLPVGGGSGSVHWQRFALGLGGRGRLGAGAFKLELGAEFLAALLSLRGQGFTPSYSRLDFDPGFGLSSRGLWSFAPHWLAWLGLGASYWAPVELDFMTSTGATIQGPRVPPVDVAVTIGVSLTGDL